MASDSPTRGAERRRWLVVAALLVVAVLLRVATLFYHEISGDDATVALIAKHVLAGENFPVFFYRQTYIGSITGLHLVPALFLFGPSVLLVRLHDVAVNLVFLLGLYVLTRRLEGEAAARAALALGAVSPFLLTYWSSVAEPHFAANTFGVVLLLLLLAALGAGSGPRYTRLLACFGLTAGLGWWQNFKIVEVAGPALLVLWIRDPWLPRRPAAAALAGGFLLGSLPAWLFYATYGDAPGYAQRLFATGLGLSAERAWTLVTTVVPTVLGTYYWPPATLARRAALLEVAAVYAGAVALALVRAARAPWGGHGPEAVRAWGWRTLLLVLFLPFALLYASSYVTAFDHESARYVLPVYIPLLACAGGLVAWLGRRSRPAAALLLAGLLAFNLWTNVAFMWPLDAAERARRAAHVAARRGIVEHLGREPVEALYVDDGGAGLRWAFLLDGVAVSELTTEIYLPDAIAADAARRVAILGQHDPTVGPRLGMLGVRHRSTRFGLAVLYDRLVVPARAYRAIPRAGWRVREEDQSPPALADGDLATAWPPETADPAPAAVVVDLGGAYRVGRVVWWPSTDWENSLPLAVSWSADGVEWERIGALPSPGTRRPAFVAGGRPFFRPRNGWLELRPAPRAVRYLRLAPLDPGVTGGWGIAELAVYEDAGERAAVDPDPSALAETLRARGITRLLADAAVSAQIARLTAGRVETLVANGVLDSHGRGEPPARLGAPVRLRAADALLVPGEDAGEVRERLADQAVTFRVEAAGDAVLFHGLAPVTPEPACRGVAWRVVGDEAGARGRLVAAVVEARLPEAWRVVGIRLEHPAVSSRYVELGAVAVSDDGRAWRPVPEARRIGQWGWAGRTLFRYSEGFGELGLPPTPARHVRIELTSPDVEGRSPVRRVCVRGAPPA